MEKWSYLTTKKNRNLSIPKIFMLVVLDERTTKAYIEQTKSFNCFANLLIVLWEILF